MEQLFLQYYNKGYNDTKIAIECNTYTKKISKLRNSLNLPRMTSTLSHKSLITYYVNKGYSDAKIAIELNMSNSNVQFLRKNLNLKTNYIERTYLTQEDRIKGYMIRNIKGSAKRRKLEFNLDYSDITLPKYCPLLEIEIDYSRKSFNNFNSATVDRMDNSKGYIKNNIIILSRLANSMKNEANFELLKTFSKNIIKVINYSENQGARGSITDIFFNNEELSLDS